MKVKQNIKTGAKSAKVTKTVQLKNAKAKVEKTSKFQTVSLAYRAWRRLDMDGYRAQGELTIAALREDSQVRAMDTKQSMSEFVAIDCGKELGFAIIGGKITLNDATALQIHAGQVEWRFEKKTHKIAFTGNYKALCAWIQKTGEGKGESKKHGTYENAIGRFSQIGFCIKSGRVARLEDNDSRNGAQWRHTVSK